MAKGTIAKVMKYELRYLDGFPSFYEMQEAVWGLQRQTREILNKTLQMAFHWDYTSREHFKETGSYLDVRTETGYKRFDGYVYECLKSDYSDIASKNLNATLQKAWKKYRNTRLDVLKGTMSLPSYRSDQPLTLDKNTVKLHSDGVDDWVELTLFSKAYKTQHDLSSNVRFAILMHDRTQRSIFQNLIDGVYALGECQLVYDKKKWFLLVTYVFTPEQHILDPEKILGVDMGEAYAIYASSVYGYGTLKIEGGEVTDYAKKLERRKWSYQKQARYCGDGRIGHGTKTRIAEVYKAEDRIANYRDTINHRYSKAVVDYAVKNGYGTIQMEDLSGIKEDTGFPRRLQHWTYYDLQTKIENKAKEHGIRVVKIDPRCTSQRCSRCGHIDPKNRPSQSQFCCTACDFRANADFNASQNISTKGIDKIIAKTLRAKSE